MTSYCECGGIGPHRCDWCKQQEELTDAKKEIERLTDAQNQIIHIDQDGKVHYPAQTDEANKRLHPLYVHGLENQLTAAKVEIERLYPYYQFALRLPLGRSFVEFGGNISSRLYTLKREHDEAVSQLSDAKVEIEELKAGRITTQERIVEMLEQHQNRVNNLESQLITAKLEIEQLKATHINQADVINRHYADLTTAKVEIERLHDNPRWWHCPTHGGQDGTVEWGCPECVKELREQITAATLEIERVNRIAEEELDEVNGKVEKLEADITAFDNALRVAKAAGRMACMHCGKTPRLIHLADTEDKG